MKITTQMANNEIGRLTQKHHYPIMNKHIPKVNKIKTYSPGHILGQGTTNGRSYSIAESDSSGNDALIFTSGRYTLSHRNHAERKRTYLSRRLTISETTICAML